jgi:hypothetical protein
VQVCRYPSSPCGHGTASSFYRPRRGGLQSCRMALALIWWHGAQCRGVDGCPGESRFGQASWQVLCLSRSGFKGSDVGASRLVSIRTPAGLTEDRRLRSGGRGGVPSSRAPTTPGMTLQCLGWWHSGGDGRTGPQVTEEMCSAGLTSRRHPGRARGRWSYPFRGFHRPLSRGATWRRHGSGRHSVVELTRAFPHNSRTASGMAARRGLVDVDGVFWCT